MIKIFYVVTFLNFASLAAAPWGKDADLAYPKSACKKQPSTIQTPLLGQFGEVMIGFHQNVISDADGPRSHYFPSSSQYTLEAMRKYGFGWGFLKGCDRLMRENDDIWIYELITQGNVTLKWDSP